MAWQRRVLQNVSLCTSLRPSLGRLSLPQLPTAVCVGGWRCSGQTPALLMRLRPWPGLSVHRKVAVGSAQAHGASDRSAVSPVLGRKAGRGQERRAWPSLPRVAPCLVSRA